MILLQGPEHLLIFLPCSALGRGDTYQFGLEASEPCCFQRVCGRRPLVGRAESPTVPDDPTFHHVHGMYYLRRKDRNRHGNFGRPRPTIMRGEKIPTGGKSWRSVTPLRRAEIATRLRPEAFFQEIYYVVMDSHVSILRDDGRGVMLSWIASGFAQFGGKLNEDDGTAVVRSLAVLEYIDAEA